MKNSVRMKPWQVIALLLVVVAAVAAAVYHAREASIMAMPSFCRDSNNTSSHVYNPARLQTFKDCTATPGIVDNLIAENDGDYHIWFHFDPRYANLLNGAQ